MEEQSKENVLTKTKLDNESEIYPCMKKSIREMKGKLTRNDTKTSEPKSSHENKTFYGRQEERDDERNSRDGYESKGSREMDKTTADIEMVDPTVNTEEKDICPDPETGTEISQRIEASDETTVEEKETTIEEITEMITKSGQEKQ
jgi:hypothetical protein